MLMLEKSYLYNEIHEQPKILKDLLAKEADAIQKLAIAIRDREIAHVVIAARGTSDNAARYAQYLLGAVNRLPVTLATPSLFSIYKRPPRFKDALVLGISQSGKSPDIVAVLAEARRQGILTTAITNFPNSDLGRTSDYIINLGASPERSIAATKTYTSELTAIACLSVQLSNDPQMQVDLNQIPENVARTLEMEPEISRAVERYRYMNACVVIGRGFNYATAFELALKLKELTYTVVEPYSSADFMHGPLAMIESGFPVIVLAPSGVMLQEFKKLIHILKERGAEVIAVSDDPEVLGMARVPFELPASVPEWLSPITTIIPGQLFAMHLAHIRDYDPDQPRGLHKVTETS